jgi:biopolymer transport protein ExbD
MHFSTRKHRRVPSVIIVSLIDVLMVVLIFLMISTTFHREEPVLKLALPESKTAEIPPGKTEDKPMIITIASNAPHFFLADRPIAFPQLQNELLLAAQKNPQLKVAVRADRKAPFGEVTKVIDAAKLAQVGALSFYTEKPALR